MPAASAGPRRSPIDCGAAAGKGVDEAGVAAGDPESGAAPGVEEPDAKPPGVEAAALPSDLRNRALNLPVAALHCGSGACSTNTLLTSVASASNSSALSGMESVSARLCGGSGAVA